MSPAAEGIAPAAASASRRRRVSWGAAFCFGSRRESGEEAAPWERWSRRRTRRTVPVVDGDLVPGTAGRDVMRRGADDDMESRKGLRFQGCCFLAPPRTPGRKHSTMDSGSGRSTHDKKQRQPEHTEQKQPLRSPAEAPAPWQTQAADGSRTRRPEQPRGAPAATRARAPTKPPRPKASSSAGVGAFGPVVGLSVVAAVSLTGLLGGRLWAVACVCAWLATLSGIRQREAGSGTADRDRRR
ncbi:unnamed protein product [Urochloa humidicola]